MLKDKTRRDRESIGKRIFRGLPKDIKVGCIICGRLHDYTFCEDCCVELICTGHNSNDVMKSAIGYIAENYKKVMLMRKENKGVSI